MADYSLFTQAIAMAEIEVAGINEQLAAMEKLDQRKALLEGFIAAAKAVVNSRQATMPSSSATTITRVADIIADLPTVGFNDRLWQVIQQAMARHGRPMTANQVLEAIQSLGTVVDGAHKRETVRNAMKRKPEVFETVHRGLFALKNWSDGVKQIGKEDLELVDDSEESNLSGIEAETAQQLLP